MKNYNRLIKGVLVFLLYFLVPYVIDMFLPSITQSSSMDLVIRLSLMFLLLLFFVFIYKDDMVRDIKALKSNGFLILGKSLMYFAIMIVGIGIISAILIALNPDFIYTNSNIIDALIKEHSLAMIVYVFVITLITEQIVFRKVFKDILQNRYFFVIFSGIIYGVFQVGYSVSSINDLCTIIPFAFAGIILSIAYEKTDNIVTPCLVYLFYNLFSLLGVII